MAQSTANQFDLRLVSAHNPWDHANDHNCAGPRMLQPYDPRWVFAVHAAGLVKASKHDLMNAEIREQVIHRASGMGLSRSDALQIISIVAGEAAAGRDPLGPGIETRLCQLASTNLETNAKPGGVSIITVSIITALLMGVFVYAVFAL